LSRLACYLVGHQISTKIEVHTYVLRGPLLTTPCKLFMRPWAAGRTVLPNNKSNTGAILCTLRQPTHSLPLTTTLEAPAKADRHSHDR
jgi:hypothetical protein